MFININTNSVFHGIALWQGRLFLLKRIKGRIPKRSANSQNCWNTKQNNKGHHNQDITWDKPMSWNDSIQNNCGADTMYALFQVSYVSSVYNYLMRKVTTRMLFNYWYQKTLPASEATFLLYICLWFCSFTLVPWHIWLGTNGSI